MSPSCTELKHLIENAARILPAQGPITNFVHHNTLHALEDQPFDEALRRAAHILGCETFFSEERYRKELREGRIRESDLEAVLRENLGAQADERLANLASFVEIRRTMLHDQVRRAPDAELRWSLLGAGRLRHFRARSDAEQRDRMVHDTRRWVLRDLRASLAHGGAPHPLVVDQFQRFDAAHIENWPRAVWDELTLTLLWRICRHGVHASSPRQRPNARRVRPRDRFLAATGRDPDLLVHGLLIPFSASFTDQGMARWRLPDREHGFLRALATLQSGMPRWLAGWRRRLGEELKPLVAGTLTPLESIGESIRELGVPDERRAEFLERTLLALRGWAGMLWQLEQRPDRVALAVPPGTLIEFLAARLILDRLALGYLARDELSYSGPLADLDAVLGRSSTSCEGGLSPAQCAFGLFLTAQSLGWTPRDLHALSRADWAKLIEQIETFDEFERRRVLQGAYERRFRLRALDALASHEAQVPAAQRPAAQVVCCLDDREESFRRHLEECAREVETFGLGGHFGVAMRYRGLNEVHARPLCPVSIEPVHEVVERPEEQAAPLHAAGSRRAHHLGIAAHLVHTGSRGFLLGVVTALLGAVAALPLVSKVLFPRLSARLRERAGSIVRAPVPTRLEFERGADERGLHGYTPDEMADIVAGQLGDIGAAANLSRLVVVMGHGSASLNNPHEAAHDCGACGGGRGGPNARVFARMANLPRVRELLAARGLPIPDDTHVLGAYHDTCSDRVDYFDLGLLPAGHATEYRWLRRKIHLACEANAHERCRRFQSADLSITPQQARRHVEGRAGDLAQARPEFGHASNALCIVGRRSRTRGLFLDRRAFLASYDPALDGDDPGQTVLARTLRTVVPVCAGINLEYYFSTVDPTGFGCGTKLPHNIAALLGVMDGASSDLRTGLPWQMVEIHEPLRLLIVVETTPERLDRVLVREPALRQLIDDQWVQLATLDPDSQAISVRRGGRFVAYELESPEPAETPSSHRWYAGFRENLEFATVTGGSRS